MPAKRGKLGFSQFEVRSLCEGNAVLTRKQGAGCKLGIFGVKVKCQSKTPVIGSDLTVTNYVISFERDSGDPMEVAQVVMKSLFDDNPKPRYLIVPNQQQAHWTINRAIERVVEQNHDQKFSYDRAALVEMLDAAIAKQAGVSQ